MAIRSQELLEEARQRAGRGDFGEDSFREGLDVLVDAIGREARLHEQGEARVREQLVGDLVRRLGVEDWYAQHPEIDEQQIAAPLFVIGLPRTGTTATSALLASDPDTRSLRTWESGRPTPPPDARTQHDDPRIERSRAQLALLYETYPEYRAMYESEATGPTECQDLLAMSFRAPHLEGQLVIPSYSAWLRECDMEAAYLYHRRVLKLLQWRCPPTRWHLKSPVHLLGLDALDRVYPDARFLWTHRDPAAVLGSACSIMAFFMRQLGPFDPLEHGRTQRAYWEGALRHALAFRERAGEERFADLHFRELNAAPLDAFERIYERIGWPMTERTRTAMSSHLASHPRGKHGVHRYALTDWGLDAADIHERYAFYTERFGVDSEGEQGARDA